MSEPLTDSLFPTVTICSVNKVSRKKLTAIIESSPKLQGISYELILQSLRYLAKIDESNKQESDLRNISQVIKSHNISTEELVHILGQTSPSCDELIIDCLWKSKATTYGRRNLLLLLQSTVAVRFRRASRIWLPRGTAHRPWLESGWLQYHDQYVRWLQSASAWRQWFPRRRRARIHCWPGVGSFCGPHSRDNGQHGRC